MAIWQKVRFNGNMNYSNVMFFSREKSSNFQLKKTIVGFSLLLKQEVTLKHTEDIITVSSGLFMVFVDSEKIDSM